MPRSRIIIIFGVLIALLPILGFPRLWESIFQVAIGISIVLLSVWATVDKRITLRAKAQRREYHRRQEDILAANKLAAESFIQEGQSEEQP